MGEKVLEYRDYTHTTQSKSDGFIVMMHGGTIISAAIIYAFI